MHRRRETIRTPLTWAGIGVVSALAGIGAGHLVAGLLDAASSPVLAVGSTVIDLTPTPVKELAVARLGTADKPVLLASVGLATLLLAAVAGSLARRRPAIGVGFLALLAGAALAAALARPATTWQDAVPGLVTGLAGVGTLLLLRREVLREGTATGGGASRRRFLSLAGGITVAGVLAAVAGQRLAARPSAAGIALPTPASPAPALPAGIETQHQGISAFRTPSEAFYRVDTNLTVPRVDIDTWSLSIDGDVRAPYTLSFKDVLAMPLVERDITMTCVSNEVGGGYVGSARWLGVRLADLLDLAQPGSSSDQLLSTAVDGFTISTPLQVLRDGRDALVAVGMNGAPLPDAHGFPVRLVTPGLYGFVGSTKWLTRLTVTSYAAQQAYWTKRGWATDAPVKTSSRIDTPAPLSTIAAGTVAIGGVAWAQHRGVIKVQVRVDDGPWQQARMGPDAGVDYWRQWYLPWNATPGQHTLAVRAVDTDGAVQTADRATPFPSGSSGIQEVVVFVQ